MEIANNISEDEKDKKKSDGWTISRMKCFICGINFQKNPGVKIEIDDYPIDMYGSVFNTLAKELEIVDSNERIVQISEEEAKQRIMYCYICHSQAWQLYRLIKCRSGAQKLNQSKQLQEHVAFVKNNLKFKFKFSKNSKFLPLLTVSANPSLFSISSYWYLRLTEFECAENILDAEKLNSILDKFDTRKLTLKPKKSGNESILKNVPSSSPQRRIGMRHGQNTGYNSNFDTMFRMDDQHLDPSEFVHVSIGNDLDETMDDETFGNYDDDDDSHLALVDMKPPRKQVLANRIGISTRAPIIRTVIRTKERMPSNSCSELGIPVKDDEKPIDEIVDHTCPVCSKNFPTRTSLVGHMCAHRKPFCPYCRQYFQSDKAFKGHNAAVHSGYESQVCFICKSKFKTPDALLQHLRSHRREKTFRCSHLNCPAVFKTKVECLTHLRGCRSSVFNENHDESEVDEPEEFGSYDDSEGVLHYDRDGDEDIGEDEMEQEQDQDLSDENVGGDIETNEYEREDSDIE